MTWKLEHEPIRFDNVDSVAMGYDPRIVKIDSYYYISWCNQLHGPTIGLARTKDFERFQQLENALLPFNRNGVLFPRKINGSYALLSRPSDNGHTAFGDIFYSESPDMTYWGKHRHVFGNLADGWAWTKVGAGPVPIETSEGWLLIYHGVQTTCNGYIYSAGAALLDLDAPWKVIRRAKHYILAPRTVYERVGDVGNVVFPCAALHDPTNDRIALYYGAADTVVALAFTTVPLLLDFINTHSA
jgi:beta-1,4-mannooligosaccharide/beta-1,4-mannosyl-N-acetylglucosamine phosphorylase